MLRLAVILLIFFPALPLLGQAVNPRIRIRVIGEDLVGSQSLGSELSSTVYVDEIGSEQKGQLDRVGQFLKEEQWSEAAEMLVRLSESDLHKLTALQSTTDSRDAVSQQHKRLVPLSHAIQQFVSELAQHAPDTLASYRERVDPLARRWLQEAQTTRDAEQLQQLVQEAFHSSYGDEALLMLGDWALERGAFDEARRHYRLIHDDLAWQSHSRLIPFWIRSMRGEVPSALAREFEAPSETSSNSKRAAYYIDSSIPKAEVWARLVLVSILQGNQRRASAELAILEKAWPNAEGSIGGQQGMLTTLLSQLLGKSNAWPKHEQLDWPTFAGNLARNAVSQLEFDISMLPAWKKELEPIDEEAQEGHRSIRARFGLPTESTGEIADRPCSTFPIIFDGKVVYKDLSRIYCLDLETGNAAWSQNEDGHFFEHANAITAPVLPFGNQKNTQLGQHRFTVCYGHGLITATMGSSLNGDATNSTLVGFDVESQGAIQFGPIPIATSQWTYHGTPLHDENRCWVGMRLREASAQDFLACFDVHTGKQLWRTRICTAETLGGNAIESTCNFLLTKYEDTIYLSTHLGTIAAVSAQTGNIRWVTQYTRRSPKTKNLTDQSWHALRDLTPCLVHDDLLIAAPSDTDQVFAMHKDTGELIWSTAVAADATKILGVGTDGKLVMSGRRLWWLDAYTGMPSNDVTVNPFPAIVSSAPTGVGRGLLSAGKVYWPANEDEAPKIYVLRQSDGKPVRQPIDLGERGITAGNLATVPGFLLIAGPEEIATFNLD